jgi:putative membrane protein
MQKMEKQENIKLGDPLQERNDPASGGNENLSIDRTRMAAERTLMAWLRTSLSMISFGFTIYKFLQAFQESGATSILRSHTPRNVGLTLIGIGTFAIIVACVQHIKYLQKLHLQNGSIPWNLALMVSCLIAMLGLLMFGSIVLNSGPFS